MTGSAAPVVLFDDDCQFCIWCAARVLALDGTGSMRAAAIQSPAGQRLLESVPPAERLDSFHFVDGDGEVTSGGAAFVPLLRELRHLRRLSGVVGALPGPATAAAYGLVAGNRVRISKLVPQGAKRRARRAVEARLVPDGAA